jgi:hypothetical protein
MKKRFEFDLEEGPPILEHVAGAISGGMLRGVARVKRELFLALDRASTRAVVCLLAAGLLVTAAVLILKAGIMGLVALHVPPAGAYFSVGILALLGGWIALRKSALAGTPDGPEKNRL